VAFSSQENIKVYNDACSTSFSLFFEQTPETPNCGFTHRFRGEGVVSDAPNGFLAAMSTIQSCKNPHAQACRNALDFGIVRSIMHQLE